MPPGGLRIYRDRLWYFSGNRETPGVVVWPSVLQTPAGKSRMVVNYGAHLNAPHAVGVAANKPEYDKERKL